MSDVDTTRGTLLRRPSTRAVRAVLATVAVGVVLGVVWALAAPAEQVAAVGDGRAVTLTGESDHRFDAVALFLCMTAAAGIVSTVRMWSSTPDESRGPSLVVTAVLGGAAGSLTAVGSGLGLASLLYPTADDAARGDVIALAPGVSTPLALVAQPLAAAVTVLVISALSPSDPAPSDPAPSDPAPSDPAPSHDAG